MIFDLRSKIIYQTLKSNQIINFKSPILTPPLIVLRHTGMNCLLSPSKVDNTESESVAGWTDMLYVARRSSSFIDGFLPSLGMTPFPVEAIPYKICKHEECNFLNYKLI